MKRTAKERGQIAKAFIVYWHPEPKTFNRALFSTAQKAPAHAEWEVNPSNLYAAVYDPVSSHANFHSIQGRFGRDILSHF